MKNPTAAASNIALVVFLVVVSVGCPSAIPCRDRACLEERLFVNESCPGVSSAMADPRLQRGEEIACCVDGIVLGDWNELYFAGQWVLPHIRREIESGGGVLSVAMRVSESVPGRFRRELSKIVHGQPMEIHGKGRLTRSRYLVEGALTSYVLIVDEIDRLRPLNDRDLALVMGSKD